MHYTQIKTLKKLFGEKNYGDYIFFMGINGFKQWITNEKVFLMFWSDYNG